MTTVGYGDISPRTFKGRFIAVLWMFISLVLVSTFTATIASILTTARINQAVPIHGLDDLRALALGLSQIAQVLSFCSLTMSNSRLLTAPGSLKHCEKEIQGIFYDEPFLRYVVRTEYPNLFTVIPLNLDTQLYAFARGKAVPCVTRLTVCSYARFMNPPGMISFTAIWETSKIKATFSHWIVVRPSFWNPSNKGSRLAGERWEERHEPCHSDRKVWHPGLLGSRLNCLRAGRDSVLLARLGFHYCLHCLDEHHRRLPGAQGSSPAGPAHQGRARRRDAANSEGALLRSCSLVYLGL